MSAAPEVRDPRALQANERTLLAWIRTGLALITFGSGSRSSRAGWAAWATGTAGAGRW
jgi:uncharacterized membrane protein YidH (DUF202 family)